jgi:hypothetical protein
MLCAIVARSIQRTRAYAFHMLYARSIPRTQAYAFSARGHGLQARNMPYARSIQSLCLFSKPSVAAPRRQQTLVCCVRAQFTFGSLRPYTLFLSFLSRIYVGQVVPKDRLPVEKWSGGFHIFYLRSYGHQKRVAIFS